MITMWLWLLSVLDCSISWYQCWLFCREYQSVICHELTMGWCVKSHDKCPHQLARFTLLTRECKMFYKIQSVTFHAVVESLVWWKANNEESSNELLIRMYAIMTEILSHQSYNRKYKVIKIVTRRGVRSIESSIQYHEHKHTNKGNGVSTVRHAWKCYLHVVGTSQ